MTESILKAIMRLFAIVTDIREEAKSGNARELVSNYLRRQFNAEIVNKYISLFEDYLAYYHSGLYQAPSKRLDYEELIESDIVKKICDEINVELESVPKMLAFAEMLEFIKEKEKKITKLEIDFVHKIAEHLNIDYEDYINLKGFVLGELNTIPDLSKLLLIDSDEEFDHPNIKHIFVDRLKGNVLVLYISSVKLFLFKYVGERNLYLNGLKVERAKTYVWAPGASIKTSQTKPVYYVSIARKFFLEEVKTQILFRATNIEYRFPGTNTGIFKFNFEAKSGMLVGIMGGSGTGKSTLLNVFNGNLKLKSGEITINGHDIHKDTEKLRGVIGFVPQEDVLIKELTVFQNMYYNAKLCFAGLSDEEVKNRVDKIIVDFDLLEARDLEVGTPEKMNLSGGQRKRLNIALELIRQPSILLVDEPTSGLSSMDSEKVLLLLKRATIRGQLVIVNIHQPSSDLYRLLDHLVILDQGGKVVFNGNPLDAIVYFKQKGNYVNAQESECITCGNIKTEQPLKIIESRLVDPHGKTIRKRKITPDEWYEMYINEFEKNKPVKENNKTDIPENNFKTPSVFGQFKIFFTRNLISKIKNKQYLYISLFETPVLAFLLAYFTKYIAGTPENPLQYIFFENKNIPAFFFISVIVALFTGLVVSAEELIKDRKIRKREKFLNLSKLSYLHSKIIYLFMLSAIQIFMYVTISNYLLEIKDMNFYHWLILFSTTCLANMIGLNISASLNSVVNIYITIPFILVPQLLFSGVVINFNDLHTTTFQKKHVPLIGDIMPSRWAFEAISVKQFMSNGFNKHFFNFHQKISECNYLFTYLIPNLESRARIIMNNKNHLTDDQKTTHIAIISNELEKLYQKLPIGMELFRYHQKLNIDDFDKETALLLISYLDLLKSYFISIERKETKQKDSLINSITAKNGKQFLYNVKLQCDNNALNNYLLNKFDYKVFFENKEELIQLKDPIYLYPYSHIGRAHFYAPYKIIFDKKIETFYFNLLIIWLMTLGAYFALVNDLLKKLISIVELFKIRRPEFARRLRI